MKKYIDQIFNEGLGASVYKPIASKLKSQLAKKIFKVVYFIIALAIAVGILILKWG